jgi:hypothetical protein
MGPCGCHLFPRLKGELKFHFGECSHVSPFSSKTVWHWNHLILLHGTNKTISLYLINTGLASRFRQHFCNHDIWSIKLAIAYSITSSSFWEPSSISRLTISFVIPAEWLQLLWLPVAVCFHCMTTRPKSWGLCLHT